MKEKTPVELNGIRSRGRYLKNGSFKPNRNVRAPKAFITILHLEQPGSYPLDARCIDEFTAIEEPKKLRAIKAGKERTKKVTKPCPVGRTLTPLVERTNWQR